MKAKQVVALMMATTLAVTGNGVTTFAEEAGNIAEAETPSSEEEAKADAGAVEDTDNAYIESVTAEADKKDNKVEDSVAITTTVKYADGVDAKTDVTAVKYQLMLDDEVISETDNGMFAYTIKSTTGTLTVRVYVTLTNGKQVYVDSAAVDLGTTTEKNITAADVAVPTFADVVAKDAAVADADTVLADQLDAFNETVKYGDWEVTSTNTGADKSLVTGDNKVNLTFTPDAAYTATSSITATVSVTVIQKAYKVEVADADTNTSGTLEIGTDGKGTKKVLTATVNDDDSDHMPTEKGVTWSTDSDKVRISSESKDRAVITALKATDANETIKVTATSVDGEAVGTYTITAITEGVTTSTISMPTAEEMAKVTFNNKYTDTKEYFNDLLDKYNEKYAEYGTFTVKSTKLQTQLDSYKTAKSTAVAGEYKDDIKVTFTLKSGLTAAGDGWTGKTIVKTYSTTVEKMKVDNDDSFEAIIGNIKDEYDYGTTLNDIVDTDAASGVNKDGEFKISWLDMKNAEVDPTTALKLGDFSYKIQYNLTDEGAVNYELVNADKTLYTVKSKIAAPEAEVKVTTTATKTGDKYNTKTNAAGVTLTATADVVKNSISELYGTAPKTYQWYKDGVALTADDNADFDQNEITVATKDGGVYTCEVSYDLDGTKDSVGSLKDNKSYATITATSEPMTVLFTSVSQADLTYPAGNITYGETKELEATIKATDVSNYRIYYKALDKDGNATGKETVLENQSVDEDMAELFKAGEVITVTAEDLPVGSYKFYLEVTTGTGKNADTVVAETADALVVSQKIVNANELDESKLEAADLTYGQKLSEAVIKYADNEISTALDFAFVDDTVADAGSYVAQKVSAKVVNDNYKLVGTPNLTADVTVAKADVTVKANDVTVEEGTTPDFTAENADLVTGVTYTVLDANGNAVDADKLAVGEYTIQVSVPEQKNYNVTTENGKLTVSKKVIAVSSVTVDRTEVSLKVGETAKVNATVAPADTTEDKTVAWVSDNTAVATVAADGTITAVAAGTANVTATVAGKTATVKVTVSKVEAASIAVDKTAVAFDTIGATEKVTATVTPDNAADKTVTWTSDNTAVATVAADGTITAVANGTATVTATTANGKTATVAVTVSQKAEKVALTIKGQKASGTLKARVGATYTLKATVTPSTADAKNAVVSWSTSNSKVATVKNGKVKVKKAGTVVITAKTADGQSAKVKFKATKNKVSVAKLTVTGKKTMKVKSSQKLTLGLAPATADNQKVTWTSSDKKVATVNKNGKVTAKKKGTVTITATAKDGSGKKATFKIKVK